ncbi:NAD-dependent epimerase/dehydratase family protein [Pelagibacterium xiamenense]|uniref:NAD-dependent epimerase/dehydratase family protein n=1 Tax=Pelagibacterium xiamenense TaxID=2901140 RepID=UPI001E308B46|nr:NAD(P)-dependent oxidoreductase [Pelagibacterium xiamenense]MCD7059805.1 NAD(P)-dependent oxidoreductase [Pelagibacterium xiamenense]
MKRLLITGAAGGVGRVMRSRLAHLAETIRVSDVAPLGDAAANEECIQCDLGDADAVDALISGCDGIVHLGGVSVEDTFEKINNANIVGLYNLYEAARAHGMPRILFASSNHVVGYYRQDEYLGTDARPKPDGLYGVSKCFGEALASMYHDKFGQETALVRIGSCFERPTNHRMLATWLSYNDFVALVERVFAAPKLGCPVIWGVSANDTAWWDNSAARYLGWTPKDNSAKFRAELEQSVERPDQGSPHAIWQGGVFTQDPIYKEDKS